MGTTHAAYFYLLFILVQSLSSGRCDDAFSFASYYTDHMVLQKAPSAAQIWGYSNRLGDEVTITAKNSLNSYTLKTKVVNGPNDKGVWKVTLPPIQQTSSPFTITAVSTSGRISISDVLFGDVWICSGQSNMHFLLADAFNSTFELDDAKNYEDVRIVSVADKTSTTALYDLQGIDLPWAIPGPKTLASSSRKYFSAVCWLYGKYLYRKLGYPIGLIAASWGATLIESWSSPDAQAKCGKPFPYNPVPGFPRKPYVLWNSMIHPLLNLTIYGALFYQGESNSPNPTGYSCSFPAMINDWREKFHQGSGGQTSDKFPFGFVQLGPSNKFTLEYGLNQIRWAQTAYYGTVPNKKMENVFMAVAMDLTDLSSPEGSVHFRDKQAVADRLVLSSLAVAYNKTGIKYQGPYPSAITLNKPNASISLQYDGGKTLLDVNTQSKSVFEICCVPPDQSSQACQYQMFLWHSVSISSHTSKDITLAYLRNDCQGDNIQALRYAWRDTPCQYKQCAVYSQINNLPAPPFYITLKDIHTTLIG